MMIDVDHFKLFNDNNGDLERECGALRAIGDTLAAAGTRNANFVGARGAAEFVLLCPTRISRDALKLTRAPARRCGGARDRAIGPRPSAT